MLKDILSKPEYDFLNNDPHLGNNVVLLTFGGSYAYGTNTPESDIDLRGIALNSAREILLDRCFEQVIDTPSDTVVYGFNKFVSLLKACNPNIIEMLGCKPEQYLILKEEGKLLLDNYHLFLSKRAVNTFGGYAMQQLKRLENKAVRTVEQTRHEQHILESINHASIKFKQKYQTYDDESIKLYLDDAVNKELDKEIFMDVTLKHYPLRDYKCLHAEMHNIVKDYAKVGSRNSKAHTRGKLGKHMMHLVRLYLMCLDILENEEIVTYRDKEHDFLMEIRNGKFLTSEDQVVPEFLDYVDELEKRLQYAKEHTNLPDKPDEKKIDELLYSVNRNIVVNN